MLAAEIDRSQNPGRKVSLAYTVVDGAIASCRRRSSPRWTCRFAPDTQTQTYMGAISASPGTYIIKLAVVDDAGKRGSVEHTVHAQADAGGTDPFDRSAAGRR